MSLRLCHPGLLSLIVDAGRPHVRSLGVPRGGAADRAALAIGNGLVGNEPFAAALEFTLVGPTMRAEHPVAAAIFGAPFTMVIDGAPGPETGRTFTLEAGQELRIAGAARGARGYLCVAGGFRTAEILGSRSGLEPLTAGTLLECATSRCEPRGLGFPWIEEPAGELHVLDGPQRDWFDDAFFTRRYEVTSAANRMGIRLAGEPLTRRPGELASEAVAPGAIQILNDGRPVILGVDGQTIGGYPKIAHVIRADFDRLAQLRPGDTLRFVRVAEDEAEALAKDRAERLRVWLARLGAAERAPRFV